MNEFGNADVGTIVLHRMGSVEGFTISTTTALAPGNAKKQYDKGRQAERKGKLDEAARELRKAVEIYPKYAVAWYELGKVEVQQKQVAEAKESFQRAVAADDKFVSPYGELAQLALNDKQWKDLADVTARIVKMNPSSFPQYWFLNGMANYNLQNFDAAEKSAVQAVNIDVQHKIPRSEYLLGMVLIQKRDYQGAMAHIRNYISMAPNSPETEAAQKQIAELEKLSAPTTSQNKQ
jgi:superkiller protein 3